MIKFQNLLKSNYILVIGLLLYTVLWSFYPHAFSSSDPALYAYRAHQIGEFWEFGEGIVFDHRWGVVIPVALIYKFFGINIITTHLWSLLAVLMIFITVWFALPTKKSRITGLVLCFFSGPLLLASATLLPDVIASAFMAFATMLLFKRQKMVNSRHWLMLSILTALTLFMAFLSKLSVYWILPLWIYYFVRDLRSKEIGLFKKFYLPLLITGFFLSLAYFISCNYIWGDPLARFRTVQELTGHHLWSTEKFNSMQFLRRLTIGPAKLLFNEYFLLPLLVLASFWLVPKKMLGWTFYAILCIGFFWFGTTSFTQYEPMPLVGRMVLPALPAIYIISAYIFSKIDFSFSKFTLKKTLISLVLLSFILLSAIHTFHGIASANLHESKAVNIIKKGMVDHPDKEYVLICTDFRNSLSLSFYFSFDYPENLNVVYIKDVDMEMVEGKDVWIYVDTKKSNFLQNSYGRENYSSAVNDLHLKELYNGNYIHLFQLKDNNELQRLLTVPE